MHIPTFQSLICLSLLTAPYVSALPLDENLQPRAATTCNANDVKTVKNSNKQPVPYCKSWLASKHSTSSVKGLNVAQVSNACKCIQASASSSSVAATKKTTSSAKKASSTKKVTSSTKKITSSTKKATTSAKSPTIKQALVASTKKSSTSSQKTTSKPTSTHAQSTSKKTSSTSLKQSTSALKTKQSSSSSIKPSSSSTSAKPTASSSSSTLSTISSSSTLVSSTFSSTFSSAIAIPTDPTSGVVANQKAPTSVSTRSASDAQTSTSISASSETSSPSINSNSASTGSDIITNGNFNGGSTAGWHGARAYGTKFSVASLAGDSNYEALVKYALAANDDASGQLYQNVSIPANSAWQLNADVYLNYPSGLPAGVSCVVKYSLGSDSIILKQYGAISTSGAVLSDTASGQLSQAFTGRFQIDTYCNSASSSAASFALGFGNIQLLISDSGSVAAATTSSAAAARIASPTASSPSTTSSAASAGATAKNMLTNGNFGTGDFSGWALYRLGNPTFAIQGNPNAYVSVITFPAGGDSNSQAALLQQPASVQVGKTYTLSMGLLLNYPSGLPADGATCSLSVYLVDSNGFGILFAQTKYGNGDAAFQSITGSGTVNSGFDGKFDILLRCYGSAQAIVAGVEDVVVSES